MTQNSKPTKLLLPFDDETQDFLRFVDKACDQAIADLKLERDRCSDSGEEFRMDLEVMATLNVARAFGILYNRCIDAGWIDGLHTMDILNDV